MLDLGAQLRLTEEAKGTSSAEPTNPLTARVRGPEASGRAGSGCCQGSISACFIFQAAPQRGRMATSDSGVTSHLISGPAGKAHALPVAPAETPRPPLSGSNTGTDGPGLAHVPTLGAGIWAGCGGGGFLQKKVTGCWLKKTSPRHPPSTTLHGLKAHNAARERKGDGLRKGG